MRPCDRCTTPKSCHALGYCDRAEPAPLQGGEEGAERGVWESLDPVAELAGTRAELLETRHEIEAWRERFRVIQGILWDDESADIGCATAWREAALRTRARMDTLEILLRDIAREPCDLTTGGYCRTHGHLPPCPVAAAVALLRWTGKSWGWLTMEEVGRG